MRKIISGKVRDVYELDDANLVIVTTDRISAFDVVLKSVIPGKGISLNLLSNFWFTYTQDIVPNHIISASLDDMPEEFSLYPDTYRDRTVKVRKLNMLPYEFIVRGYLFGSMWEAYKKGYSFCGHIIDGEYKQAQRLASPIVTPAKKMNSGHDQYISLKQLSRELGNAEAERLCKISLDLYNRCSSYALERGIIIADTKFEFGYNESGELMLGDEIFTPDSSRFWNAWTYQTGQSPNSYDKQFVRDWLICNHLNGFEPAPELPEEIVNKTAKIYHECLLKFTGD